MFFFFCDSAMHAEIKGFELLLQVLNELLENETLAYGHVDQEVKQSGTREKQREEERCTDCGTSHSRRAHA